LSVAAWLVVFLSPGAYILLLVFWNRLQMPAPPAGLVVALFGLVPVLALLVCGSVVWRRKLTVCGRVGWLVSTLLAMVLQIGLLLVIIRGVLIAAISYAP